MDLSIELTRPFRSLRVWFAIKVYGLEFFKKSLEHKHLLSNYTQRKLEQIEGIEIFSQNELSICSFSMESSDKTKALLKKINENKKVFSHLQL